MRRATLVCGLVLAAACLMAPHARSQSAAAPFQVRHLKVKGESLPYAVWLPPGYDSTRAWPCVLFLHGSGESGTDGLKPTLQGIGPALLEHPERWPCVVLLPQKPREDEEWEEHEVFVLQTLRAAEKSWRIDPDRVALAGISQGGHGAWVFGARHASLWSCLVPVCGYGRAHTVAPRAWRLPVWAFHGLKDDVVDPRDTQSIVADLARRKREAGLPEPKMTLYPDLNHGCWATAFGEPALPEWILAQKRGNR
jgi:predicted peptidase